MANNRFKTIGPNASMEELANHNKNWDTVDTALTSVESGLRDKQANIDAETRAREEAITNEKAARIDADNKEAQARIDAVNQEAQARAAADTLETQQRIEAVNAEASVRAAADATETQARIAADTAHQNSTAAHDADNITFTPGSSGLTSTKAGQAIREVKTQLQNIVSSQVPGKDNEVIAARMGYDGVARPSLDVMVKELHQNEFTLENAIAELTRQQAMSGVIDYVGNIKVGLNSASNGTPYGQIAVTNTGNANRIDVGFFNAIVNGYKVPVSGFNNPGGYNVNIINLNAAPTYGYREDLVFLEAWFPQTGPKGIMSWRIRIVDGIDFTKYPEGLGSYGALIVNPVQAQGGNAQPLAPTAAWDSSFFNRAKAVGATGIGMPNQMQFVDDAGLYVAGMGSQSSKDLLKTADGYVYAIPLLRVKRRNSSGYRKDNLNGGVECIAFKSKNTVQISAGVSTTIILQDGQGIYVKAGDRLYFQGNMNTNVFVDVTAVTGDTITVTPNYSGTWNTNDVFTNKCDRPDGLYYNIIDASDIIDLRHKVSLTGVNYQQILDEHFDKLLTGDLITKDTKTMQKEVYGLRRAPLGITQELMPTTIKRADGSSVDLVNLLGIVGRCEDISKFSSVAGGTVTLDTSSKLYGASSVQGITNVSTGIFQNRLTVPTIDSSKYYIVVLEINNVSMVNTYARVMNIDGASAIKSNSANPVTTTGWKTHYLKLSPIELSGVTSFRIDACGTISATGQKMNVDGFRLYQIDQATYNLIDNDPNWTGGDKIGVLFPYTDSNQNFVENLFDKNSSTIQKGYAVNDTNGTIFSSSGKNVTDFIPILSNTQYTITYPASDGRWNAFYDSNKMFISGTSGIETFTTPSNAAYIRMTVSDSNLDSGMQLEKGSSKSPFVPYGRYYLEKDLGNAHLNNNQLPTYRYEGANGGNFNGQRLVYSDAQTSQTVIDVVEALKTPQRHIKVTQAIEGQWANGDKIVISSDYGMISGIGATASKILRNDGSTSTVYVGDTSKFALNDTVQLIKESDWSASSSRTITAIDSTNGTVTLNLNVDTSVVYYLVKTNALPSIGYTTQQNKATQGGSTSTTIKLAADASAVDNYYKDLILTIVSGTGSGQSRTISGYVGSTKIATISSAWATIPDATSVYSVSIAGNWTNLGTKSVTFTIGNVPTATESTLGDANKLNITIASSVNYPAGKGMNYVPTDVLKAEVNGQELLASNTVSVKANYLVKTRGNSDLIPHKCFWENRVTTLNAPSSQWFSEMSDSGYGSLYSLDGSTYPIPTSISGGIAQKMFTFDLIRAIEDKYGEIPADGTAAKVAWLKANVSSITCDWWGYGSSPVGNKAYGAIWDTTLNSGTGGWSSAINHTSSAVLKLALGSTLIGSRVDSNGFVYFLTYADPSDGIVASTIYTDYVELSITIKTPAISAFDNATDASGYVILQPTNPFPVLSDNILAQNQALPVDLNGYGLNTPGTTLSMTTQGIQVSTDGTNKYQGIATSVPLSKGIYTITVWIYTDKPLSGMQLGYDTFTKNADLQIGLNAISLSINVSSDTTKSLIFHTNNTNRSVTFTYVKAMIQSGSKPTDWIPGRKKKSIVNYLGKVKGSTAENPNRIFFKTVSSFDPPSSFSIEAPQSDYDSMSKVDGIVSTLIAAGSGQYAQMMYEFDLSYLGLSLTELKKAIRSITIVYSGYGSGDNAGSTAYGTYGSTWLNNAWYHTSAQDTGASTVATTSALYNDAYSISGLVTNTQKVYFLVRSTYPASATTPSQVFTDYVRLDVVLADYVDYVPANIVKVRPETKEIKTFFPSVSRRYLGGNPRESEQIALWYRYILYQGIGSIGKSKILSVGTPLITTMGTGGYTSELDYVSIKNMSTRLPSPVPDYKLTSEKFLSEGIRTCLDSLRLMASAVHTQGNTFRLTARSGSYFDPTTTTIENVVRGSVMRPSISTDTIRAADGQAIYKFSLPTTFPMGEALISLPMLVHNAGELFLVVVSFRRTADSNLQFYSNQAVFDCFRIYGKPLMKGL